jgi:hypothetical protein
MQRLPRHLEIGKVKSLAISDQRRKARVQAIAETLAGPYILTIIACDGDVCN